MIRRTVLAVLCATLLVFINPALASKFTDDLERVDEALRTNPHGKLRQSLLACKKQRDFAYDLYRDNMTTQAERYLRYCFDLLGIPEDAPVEKVSAVDEAELVARAEAQYDKATALKPDAANGLKIYAECAACHKAEGWGSTTGSVPQIAGQHRTVIIKQLADYRTGARGSALMAPYAATEVIGGVQAVADVAEYVSTLPISVDNGKGPGIGLPVGERVYAEKCAQCHGANGEGSNERQVPRLQAQHYKYLLRQFEWIRSGKRGNADAGMVAQTHGLQDNEVHGVLDYLSRLMPQEALRAPEGWKNPDFK